MSFIRIAIFICSLVCIPLASAHSDQPSYEKQIGPYLLDIGYSQAPVPGQPVRFDFDLYTNTGADVNYASFNDITFSITKDGQLIVSQTIQNTQPNVPTYTYTFPTEGVYAVAVTYERGKDAPLSTSFDLRVSNVSGWIGILDSVSHQIATIFLAIVAIVVFTIMILQRRKS
ncbi:MAG TPA: hypothetical protein VHA78_02600 [Candidatus Peribacteraceae bacterium]|nr:hypothetical protein [Candidatus Peribacteraceae bacterium]